MCPFELMTLLERHFNGHKMGPKVAKGGQKHKIVIIEENSNVEVLEHLYVIYM